MSIPSAYMTVLGGRESTHGRWLEIEGIPYGYGSFTASGAFFAARSATQQLLGLLPYLSKVPKSIDQSIDTLDGGAMTAGSVNFELADIDGSLTQLIGVGYQTGFTVLAAEIDENDTTITFPNGGGAAFAANGYFYLGTETIKIGAVTATTFTGCTRGMFRSKPQAFGQGIPIGTRPYTMANRRCWYNQVALTGTGATLSAAADADKCIRVAGILSGFISKEPNTYQLTVHTMDKELDQEVFRNLRSFILTADIFGNDDGAPYVFGSVSTNSMRFPNAEKVNELHTAFVNVAEFYGGEYFLIRVDNEVFAVQYTFDGAPGGAGGELVFLQRGLFGTDVAEHLMPNSATEVISVVEYAPVLGVEASSKFTAPTPDGVHSDHPLALLLQVLTSTGNGTPQGVLAGLTPNGDYDVLPADWGRGLDISRVDLVGIERAMLEEPQLRFGGIIEKPVNFVAFARDLLSFAGYYYYVAIGDLFSVRRLRPPDPDEAADVHVITDASRIRNRHPTWEANWSGAVREIVFSYGWDIINHSFKFIEIFKSAGGDLYSKGVARSLKYESTLLYPGHSGIPGEPPFQRFDVHAWLVTRAEFFKNRYGRPPPILHETLTYAFLDVEIGDVVQITNAAIPNTSTGALGMASEVGEVISKSVDDVSKTVNLTCLMTNYQLANYRFIAPSMETDGAPVVDAAAPPDDIFTYTLKTNVFCDNTGPAGGGQIDMYLQHADGQYAPVFPVDVEVLLLWKPDFSASVECDVLAYDAGNFTIQVSRTGGGAFPAWAAGTDLFFTLNSFLFVDGLTDPELGETLTNKYAFAAEDTDTMGAAPAHRYFPT